MKFYYLEMILSLSFFGVLYTTACNEPPSSKKSTSTKQLGVTASSPEKKLEKPIILKGAGATFPFPIYSKWAKLYEKVAGAKIKYVPIGSGGGIAQIKAKTVDFGASDAPLDSDELIRQGLIQFPMVVGGVVPVVNLDNVPPGALRLTPELLADIFLGKVTRWNSKPIAEINSDLTLPDKAISVVHRIDGSGTTWIFTSYLTQNSTAWSETVGKGKAVDWPVGLGGEGNEGVAAFVQEVPGSIGYVEFAYALGNEMSSVQLKNRAGVFVSPTIESFQHAATGADWKNAPGFSVELIDQPGANAWPVTGASFVLIHRRQEDPIKAKAMLSFFDWCYSKGTEEALKLHYVPIPDEVVRIVTEFRNRVVVDGEGKPLD